jgi:hypothetical protein
VTSIDARRARPTRAAREAATAIGATVAMAIGVALDDV